MAPTPQEALESLRTAHADATEMLAEAVSSITSDLQDVESNIPDVPDLSDVEIDGVSGIEDAVDAEVADVASDIASEVASAVGATVERVVEDTLSSLGSNVLSRVRDEITVDEDSLPDMDGIEYVERGIRSLHSNFERQQYTMEARLGDIAQEISALAEAIEGLPSVTDGEMIHLKRMDGQWIVLDPEVDHLTEAPVDGPTISDGERRRLEEMEASAFRWTPGLSAIVRQFNGEWPITAVHEDHVEVLVDEVSLNVRLEDLTRPSYVIDGGPIIVGQRVSGELGTTGRFTGVLCGMEPQTPGDSDVRHAVIRREDGTEGGGGLVGPRGWLVDLESLRLV